MGNIIFLNIAIEVNKSFMEIGNIQDEENWLDAIVYIETQA